MAAAALIININSRNGFVYLRLSHASSSVQRNKMQSRTEFFGKCCPVPFTGFSVLDIARLASKT